MSDIKTCSACNKSKPLGEFSRAKSYKDGFRGQCKECRANYTKNYNERTGYKPSKKYKSGEKTRDDRLRLKYGITQSDYDAMLAAQGGTCAICNAKPDDIALSVDHCHQTGRVRGLLCFKCNTGIGRLGDNVHGIFSALLYLASGGIRTIQ